MNIYTPGYTQYIPALLNHFYTFWFIEVYHFAVTFSLVNFIDKLYCNESDSLFHTGVFFADWY
jgi:hypothetical protein